MPSRNTSSSSKLVGVQSLKQTNSTPALLSKRSADPKTMENIPETAAQASEVALELEESSMVHNVSHTDQHIAEMKIKTTQSVQALPNLKAL